MVRLGCVLLVLTSTSPAVAAAEPGSAEKSTLATTLQVPHPESGFKKKAGIGRKQIAPNAEFGFGLFGLKSEKSPLRPSVVGEINMPKQRRAAVGFSLKF